MFRCGGVLRRGGGRVPLGLLACDLLMGWVVYIGVELDDIV